MNRKKSMATLLMVVLLAFALIGVVLAKPLPRGIRQEPALQRMILVLSIGGESTTIAGDLYYRALDDGDAAYHAVLVVDGNGAQLLCHWTLLEEGYMGWIINARGFNMHLYPTGERTRVLPPPTGESWRYVQPVEGHSYGAVVTGYLCQIGP